MEYLSTPNEVFGHFAYAMLALSYVLTNILWLRVTAVISMFLEIVYFYYSGGNLATGIGWTVLFILINFVQLYWLMRERLAARLPEAEAAMLRAAFTGLDDSQIARLLKAAEWKDCPAGEVLTTHGKPVEALSFLCSGRARVEVEKSFVAYVEKGFFVGEIAYLTGNPASATVMLEEPARVLRFSPGSMAKLVASESEISGIFHQVLGRDLAYKLSHANARSAKLLSETAALA